VIDPDHPQRALGPLWEREQHRASERVARASDVVERWAWANGETHWERPEPLWHQLNGLDPSDKTIDEPTGELGYLVLYGYDGEGRIVIARRVAGGIARDPDFISASVWITANSGDRVLLTYDAHGIRRPRPLQLSGIIAPIVENDRVRSVVAISGPHDPGSRSVFQYDADRVTLVTDESHVDGEWRPQRVYECSYSDDDLSAIVCFRVDAAGGRGEPIISWRRSSSRRVRGARQRIERELPDRLVGWASRRAPRDTFAIALLYSFEGPNLPPAIGACTERERRRLASQGVASQHIWNPAEWEVLDTEPEELLADGLDECWQVLSQEWQATLNDKEPRTLLTKAASRITPEQLAAAQLSPDVVVFAVDDELTDLDRNLRKVVPAPRRRELES
jgi:hypothetical protein